MNRALSVAILSFLILMGSLFQTKRFVEFKFYSVEESVEYDKDPLFVVAGVLTSNHAQIFYFSSHWASTIYSCSQFVSTMPQLLSAYRISLPPPSVSLFFKKINITVGRGYEYV